MTDITKLVSALRFAMDDDTITGIGELRGLSCEAAALIETLAKERDELREALNWIDRNHFAHSQNMVGVARRALEGTK